MLSIGIMYLACMDVNLLDEVGRCEEISSPLVLRLSFSQVINPEPRPAKNDL